MYYNWYTQPRFDETDLYARAMEFLREPETRK